MTDRIEETVREYRFEDFVEQQGIPGFEDSEIVRKEEAKEFHKTNRVFWVTGLVALLTGIGVVAAQNFIPNISEGLAVGLGAVGLGALLVGGFTAIKKIFRKSKLDLPSLTVRRKAFAQETISAEPARKRSRGLRKKMKGKIFMGVAGGIARFADTSPSMVRLLFLIAFFFSGGSFAILYVLLGLILPED